MLFTLNLKVQLLKKLRPCPENVGLRCTAVLKQLLEWVIKTSKNAILQACSFSIVKSILGCLEFIYSKNKGA